MYLGVEDPCDATHTRPVLLLSSSASWMRGSSAPSPWARRLLPWLALVPNAPTLKYHPGGRTPGARRWGPANPTSRAVRRATNRDDGDLVIAERAHELRPLKDRVRVVKHGEVIPELEENEPA